MGGLVWWCGGRGWVGGLVLSMVSLWGIKVLGWLGGRLMGWRVDGVEEGVEEGMEEGVE